MMFGDLFLQALMYGSLAIYLSIPVALVFLIRSKACQSYRLEHLGTLLGFAPFIVLLIAIFSDNRFRYFDAFFELDYRSALGLIFSFCLCLVTVILLHFDAKSQKRPSVPYVVIVALFVLAWFLSFLASNLVLLMINHRGPIM